MRKHADWMAYADERVLEYLRENGNSQPSEIASGLSELGDDMGFNPKYIGRRCRKLDRFGLVDRTGRGVYQLTDTGDAYLDGEYDAGSLEA